MTEIEQYQSRSEIALSNSQDVAVQRLGEWAQSAQAAYHVAENLVRTSFVPEGFRGKPHEATAAILSGLEVGLSPMAALRSFDVIQGTAAPRAITLRAIVQSHGHEMEVVESTATRCKMRGRRKGATTWQDVVWTIDRAKQLGLTGKANWKNQPQAMLLARATSETARLIAADAILGIGYSAEEVADGGTAEQVTAAATTDATPTATRKLSRTTARRPEPEEQPSEPQDEPQDEPDPGITDRTRRALFALMGEVGINTDDDQRDFLTDTLGRVVESRSTLTEAEGVAAGKRLRAIQRGDSDAEWVPTFDAEPAADEPAQDGAA